MSGYEAEIRIATAFMPSHHRYFSVKNLGRDEVEHAVAEKFARLVR